MASKHENLGPLTIGLDIGIASVGWAALGKDCINWKRLVNNLPPDGSVRCLTVTEKRFASMKLLVGLPLFQEKAIKVNQMLLF